MHIPQWEAVEKHAVGQVRSQVCDYALRLDPKVKRPSSSGDWTKTRVEILSTLRVLAPTSRSQRAAAVELLGPESGGC